MPTTSARGSPIELPRNGGANCEPATWNRRVGIVITQSVADLMKGSDEKSFASFSAISTALTASRPFAHSERTTTSPPPRSATTTLAGGLASANPGYGLPAALHCTLSDHCDSATASTE